ncbi:MAG TPA: hypothetical protein VGZ00_09825 [Candidatus Baltobacteraceae bacterium]|jgi:hypothetical protein|nr:hypothetical protein [Candidatus Baltobacteraceae bacterium]
MSQDKMRQIKREPTRFDVFEAFSSDTATGGGSIIRLGAIDDFFANARDSVDALLKNEAFLYGKRTEKMFESVVVSLGKARLIKTEDTGGWYNAEGLAVPDFRVILEDGNQFLVEVKNHHKDWLRTPFSITSKYFENLQRYGEWMGCPIRLAVYWSTTNHWTVVPLETLKQQSNVYELSFHVAMKSNLMASFGDVIIGTTPPLEIHHVADLSHPRSFDGEEAEMTLGELKYFCAGREITDKIERGIAFILMAFGNWNEESSLEFDEQGLPSHIVYEYKPGGDRNPEEERNQKIKLIGALSGMYSRYFVSATVDETEGDITKIQTKVVPGWWGELIPKDYDFRGATLRLLRLRVQPS